MHAPVEVRFVIELDDVLANYRLVTRRIRHLPLMLVVALAFGAVAAALAGMPAVAGGLGVAALVVLASTRGSPLERWLLARQARPILGLECVVRADEEGVAFEQGGTAARIAWSDVREFVSDEHAMLVVGPPAWRLGVPVRAFTRPDELAWFRDRAAGAAAARRRRAP